MSRAVILTMGGDPFIASLVLKLWKERWYNEIDTFYINFNNGQNVPSEFVGEFLSEVVTDPKIHLIYHPNSIGSGRPIAEIAKIATEDTVMFLEDDAFIFTPGAVDSWFKKIESGETDIVGSPRYGTGEVSEAAQKMYSLDYSGLGDQGFAWWPNFFVCKREDLLKTDLDFGSNAYEKGQLYKQLDHTFSENCFTDTFAWASIQLRYLGLREYKIPQNHAHPYDLENQVKGEMMFANGNPKYIHGG